MELTSLHIAKIKKIIYYEQQKLHQLISECKNSKTNSNSDVIGLSIKMKVSLAVISTAQNILDILKLSNDSLLIDSEE